MQESMSSFNLEAGTHLREEPGWSLDNPPRSVPAGGRYLATIARTGSGCL